MADTSSHPDIPQVEDKRSQILGLLPKNAQARLLGCIALVMILVIAFSGRKPTRERAAGATAPVSATVDPNQARIQEYRAQIEEQTRKLAAEESQLAQTKQSLGMHPEEPASVARYQQEARLAAMSEAAGPYAPAPQRTWIETDREKREYQAPFASNVALSYRSPEAAVTPALPNRVHPTTQAEAGEDDEEESDAGPVKRYRILEGTVFETVLTNRLDSSFSGPVNCMVTTNVYSEDQKLLIPQGSRVLGEVRKLEGMGEQRLAVFFHRVILPNGYSIRLDRFQGLNQIGETGLRDQVNHHYLQIFGVSIAIGAIAGLAQANTHYSLDQSAAQSYEQGVSSSLSQSAMHILDRYLNVLPTMTIREGQRIKIYLSQDLMAPAYDSHSNS